MASNSRTNVPIIEAVRYFLLILNILILLNNDVKPIVIKSLKDESLIQLILPIKTY